MIALLFFSITALAQPVDHALLVRARASLIANRLDAIPAISIQLGKIPGSPLLKEIQLYLGILETRSKFKAVQETGFARLTQIDWFGLVDEPGAERYLLGCSKKPVRPCLIWSRRIARGFPRNHRIFEKVRAFVTPFMDETPEPMGEKLSTSYRPGDPDVLVFEEKILPLLVAEKWDEAITELESALTLYPRSRQRFKHKYWLARALTLSEELDRAKPLYEEIRTQGKLTSYGILAGIELGNPLTSLGGGETSLRPVLALQSAPPLDLVRVERAKEFSKKNQPACESELREFKPKEQHASSFLLETYRVASECDAYSTAFVFMNEYLAREGTGSLSVTDLRGLFPRPGHVLKALPQEPLDRVVMLSLIKQESSFDTLAYSSAGAMGLAQLIYPTALEVDPSLTRYTLLMNPAKNVEAGGKYFKRLLAQQEGDLALAIAAYNAGPTAVGRFKREFTGACLKYPDLKIECIPYRETREYVFSVLRNRWWYRGEVEEKEFWK